MPYITLSSKKYSRLPELCPRPISRPIVSPDTSRQSRSKLHYLQAVLLPAAPSIVMGGSPHTQMPYAEALIAEVTYLCKLPVEVTCPESPWLELHQLLGLDASLNRAWRCGLGTWRTQIFCPSDPASSSSLP